MFVTIITDCCDDNARTRQETRYAHLFPGTHVSFIGAANDLEAAGNLVDILDAADDSPGVIAVNCAPRNGRAKKWKNGSPFGYCWVDNKLIVGTIDGYTFSYLKKFKLVDSIKITDIPTALAEGGYTKEEIEKAAITQFRSFNYLPRLAKIVWEKKEIQAEEMPISEVPDIPDVIWWVDSFGNCKTTLTSQDIGFESGVNRMVTINNQAPISIPCVAELKDVTDGEAALIVGSSGMRGQHYVELVVQGASAAEKFNIKKTDEIKIG